MAIVAVIQAAPVFLNLQDTVKKTVDLIGQAAALGARLILFPEAFIAGYPRGLTFGTVVGNRSQEGRVLWQKYWENAIDVPGPETELLGAAAKKANAAVAVGVTERNSAYSRGTLFCTVLFFSSDGKLAGLHRKVKPTGAERLIWGEGDGSTMPVIETPAGRVGALICWENYMPLARMAMYSQGIQILLMPTADSRDIWQATIRHIAYEGRCFVLSCNQFFDGSMYPTQWRSLPELAGSSETVTLGRSAIINPMGEIIAGPLEGREGIIVADLDLTEITRAKFDFDVIGHYARPDIFRLIVDKKAKCSVSWRCEPEDS